MEETGCEEQVAMRGGGRIQRLLGRGEGVRVEIDSYAVVEDGGLEERSGVGVGGFADGCFEMGGEEVGMGG